MTARLFSWTHLVPIARLQEQTGPRTGAALLRGWDSAGNEYVAVKQESGEWLLHRRVLPRFQELPDPKTKHPYARIAAGIDADLILEELEPGLDEGTE